jgi:hypothetical protein
MPFITKTTGVSGPSSGAMPAATEGSAGDFTVTITASCGPSSSGLSVARGREWKVPSRASTVSPRSWIAARCAPRAMTETSAPPRAKRPARCPPIAPAP